jgi:saccharopine dehydrogenase-like NADP-dependent oxidoreductase
MRVEVHTADGDRRTRHRFDLLDRYDRATDTQSMARTTGYTCTAAVRVVAEGLYDSPGITPPEVLARNERCFNRIFALLAERGVMFRRTEEAL